MDLYNYIYALEYQNRHICICPHCFHLHLYPNMFTKLDCPDMKILKIKYNVNIEDIINNSDINDVMKDLLIDLSIFIKFIKTDKCVTSVHTDRYIGICNIYDILLKTNIDTNKQLFHYKILY